MKDRYKYRVWEPLNKEIHYMNTALYECDSDNKKQFALPLNHQGLAGSYTSMNLDSLILMQCSGVSDNCAKLIYEGDIAKYIIYGDEQYIGVVKFGEYEQDGSGGEYGGRKCLGFYIERTKVVLSEWEDEDDIEWRKREHQETLSIFEPDAIEVVGNIYDNPELVEQTSICV